MSKTFLYPTNISKDLSADAVFGTASLQFNDYQTAIAAAVEQQSATTGEMGRNVTQAAAGSGSIAESLTGLTATVDETRAAPGGGDASTCGTSAELAFVPHRTVSGRWTRVCGVAMLKADLDVRCT